MGAADKAVNPEAGRGMDREPEGAFAPSAGFKGGGNTRTFGMWRQS